MKKIKSGLLNIFFTIVLANTVFIESTTPVFAVHNDYSNHLLKINFEKSQENGVNVIIYSASSYNINITPIQKSKNEYIILLPETYHSITSKPDITSFSDKILDVDVKLLPHVESNSNNGYTKITVKTAPNINLSVVKKIINNDYKVESEILSLINNKVIENPVVSELKVTEKKKIISSIVNPKDNAKNTSKLVVLKPKIATIAKKTVKIRSASKPLKKELKKTTHKVVKLKQSSKANTLKVVDSKATKNSVENKNTLNEIKKEIKIQETTKESVVKKVSNEVKTSKKQSLIDSSQKKIHTILQNILLNVDLKDKNLYKLGIFIILPILFLLLIINFLKKNQDNLPSSRNLNYYNNNSEEIYNSPSLENSNEHDFNESISNDPDSVEDNDYLNYSFDNDLDIDNFDQSNEEQEDSYVEELEEEFDFDEEESILFQDEYKFDDGLQEEDDDDDLEQEFNNIESYIEEPQSVGEQYNFDMPALNSSVVNDYLETDEDVDEKFDFAPIQNVQSLSEFEDKQSQNRLDNELEDVSEQAEPEEFYNTDENVDANDDQTLNDIDETYEVKKDTVNVDNQMPEVLSEKEIENDKALFLIDDGENKALVGVIGSNVFVLNKFQNEIIKNKMLVKFNEKKFDKNIYLVKIQQWRGLVGVTEDKMELMLEF